MSAHCTKGDSVSVALSQGVNPAGGSSAANSTINPHHDPALPPTVVNHDAAVASVVALGAPDLVGYPYAHQNTDHAMKWRLTTAGHARFPDGHADVKRLLSVFAVAGRAVPSAGSRGSAGSAAAMPSGGGCCGGGCGCG